MTNVEIIKKLLFDWQQLTGAIIGASAPFVLWWIVEKYQQRKLKRENLDYLERLIVDQINMIIEIERVIRTFIDNRLGELIKNINANPDNAYSVNRSFFPLFSVRVMSENIHGISTRSNYLDNKLAQAYAMSKDLPHIIDDTRQQFTNTIELNEKIAFMKVNPPQAQKQSYLENIKNFRVSLSDDMIDKNIPIYLKTLVQAQVALSEFRKMGFLLWRIKFDPKFRFFWKHETFNKAKEDSYNKIESFFEPRVDKILNEISKRMKNGLENNVLETRQEIKRN